MEPIGLDLNNITNVLSVKNVSVPAIGELGLTSPAPAHRMARLAPKGSVEPAKGRTSGGGGTAQKRVDGSGLAATPQAGGEAGGAIASNDLGRDRGVIADGLPVPRRPIA
jgi:hypothetical protein